MPLLPPPLEARGWIVMSPNTPKPLQSTGLLPHHGPLQGADDGQGKNRDNLTEPVYPAHMEEAECYERVVLGNVPDEE